MKTWIYREKWYLFGRSFKSRWQFLGCNDNCGWLMIALKSLNTLGISFKRTFNHFFNFILSSVFSWSQLSTFKNKTPVNNVFQQTKVINMANLIFLYIFFHVNYFFFSFNAHFIVFHTKINKHKRANLTRSVSHFISFHTFELQLVG